MAMPAFVVISFGGSAFDVCIQAFDMAIDPEEDKWVRGCLSAPSPEILQNGFQNRDGFETASDETAGFLKILSIASAYVPVLK